MPRAAMSVATSTRTSPLLKPAKARVRAPWLLLPWMAAAEMPSCSNRSDSRLAPCLVRENTSTCCQSWLWIRWQSRSGLRPMSQGCCTCWTRGAAWFSGVACSCTGWCSRPVASWRISLEKVAENSRFWRWAGIRAKIRRMSRMKPMSSMRSASSSTRISTRSSLRAPCCCRSIRRPGVATNTSVPRRRRLIWGLGLTPPNTTSLRRSR